MDKQINDKDLPAKGVQVEVVEFPISDRYCHIGAIGTVKNGQIRVGGCWFNFDERWKVK